MYVIIRVRKLFRKNKFKDKVFGPFVDHRQAGEFVLGLKPWFINKWRLKYVRIVSEDKVSCDTVGCKG